MTKLTIGLSLIGIGVAVATLASVPVLASAAVGVIVLGGVVGVAGVIVSLAAVPELKRERTAREGKEEREGEGLEVERLARVERFQCERDELTAERARWSAARAKNEYWMSVASNYGDTLRSSEIEADLAEIAAKDSGAERRLVVVAAALAAIGEN